MKSSPVGYALTLVGGILTIIVSFLFLIGFVAVISGGSIWSEYLGALVLPVSLLSFILFILFVLILAIGIVKIYSARMMKDSKSTLTGGIIALVMGVITSDPFSVIGGIIAVIQGAT